MNRVFSLSGLRFRINSRPPKITTTYKTIIPTVSASVENGATPSTNLNASAWYPMVAVQSLSNARHGASGITLGIVWRDAGPEDMLG